MEGLVPRRLFESDRNSLGPDRPARKLGNGGRWRTGRITVSRREGFRKIYNLTKNVIPQDIRSNQPTFDDSVDWACRGALRALGFATAKEVSEFMNLQPPPKRGPGSRKG